jgi:8-oxo-dGTP pyrophosphatase MutT (NUDIX family)
MKRSAAVVALCPRGKVLVLRRGPTDPWAPGMWCLPGGGAESHESLEQAARREAFEYAEKITAHPNSTWLRAGVHR